MKNACEYAVYRGEEILFIGTADEIAKHFNVKKKTVWFWASPANKKLANTGNRPGAIPRKRSYSKMKIAIRLDNEEE